MKLGKILQIAFICVISFVLYFFLRHHWTQIKEAFSMQPKFLIALIALNVLNKLFLGFKTKKLFDVFGIRLGFMDWFGASVINNFYNYLAPKSGTAVVGVFLKKKHGIGYDTYASSLLASSMMTVATSGAFGLLVYLYLFINKTVNNGFLLLAFLLLTCAPILVVVLVKSGMASKGIFRKVKSIIEGWKVIGRCRNCLISLCLMDIGTILCMSLRYWILFRIFSLKVGVLQCIMISPLNMLTQVATPIPGAYGIREAVVGVVAKIAGIGFVSGVLTTLSDRIIMMSVAFVLGPIFSFILLRKTVNGKNCSEKR